MRAVIKHSYVKGRKALAKAKAHVNYLQHRPGEDREQGPRRFFDADREHIDGREVKQHMARFEEERGMVVHKLILSPGCDGVDLQAYTRETLEEYGRLKGLDLDWKAIAHTNTDHDHIHVVVMGSDKNGRLVRFDRQDYKQLRELQDRYIEREHKLERYLDREMADLLREGSDYRREGDRQFQKLIGHDRDEDDRTKRPFKDLTIERQFDLLDKTNNWHAAFGGSSSHEISRRLSRREVIRRQQGRMQEYHADYESRMAEKYWQDLAERDPSQAAAAQKQLEYIKEFKQEQTQDTGWRDLDSLLGERHSRTDREDRQKVETRMQVREHIQMHQQNERSEDEKSRDDEGRGE